jgi:hypothetical protein
VISCFLVVSFLNITSFNTVEFGVDSLQQAEYLSAMYAGRAGRVHGAPAGMARVGFVCEGGEWVNLGIAESPLG